MQSLYSWPWEQESYAVWTGSARHPYIFTWYAWSSPTFYNIWNITVIVLVSLSTYSVFFAICWYVLINFCFSSFWLIVPCIIACPIIFDWLLGIVNFTLLMVAYFCVPGQILWALFQDVIKLLETVDYFETLF